MTAPLRRMRVGDRVPSALLGRMGTRRLDATAIVVPGTGDLVEYLRRLEAHAEAFAAWDGRVHVAPPDTEPLHRLLIVDRYRQVYAVQDAAKAAELPDADAVAEWFRFLATACPECGVLDDPLLAGPTP